jgi:hypothetical protein
VSTAWMSLQQLELLGVSINQTSVSMLTFLVALL